MKYHAQIVNENGARAAKGGNERLTITVADGNNIVATLVIDKHGIRYDDGTPY